ncbi:unnamed protein product [Cochlearia groenlandica]
MTEAKSWWEKVGDSIGGVVGDVGKAVGNFKAVEIGLSIDGGSCVREIMSVNTNFTGEECIALNDPRAPMYMKIENVPSDVSVGSILKKPVDYIKKNYPNFWKAWSFNKKNKIRKPRRALLL